MKINIDLNTEDFINLRLQRSKLLWELWKKILLTLFLLLTIITNGVLIKKVPQDNIVYTIAIIDGACALVWFGIMIFLSLDKKYKEIQENKKEIIKLINHKLRRD